MIKQITFAAGLLLLSACSSTNGHYTAISTKPMSLWDLDQNNQRIAQKVGELEGRHIAVVIPSGRTPNVGDVVAKILDEYHGDYLADADITHRSFQLMFWYHYSGWEVTGDVMKIVR